MTENQIHTSIRVAAICGSLNPTSTTRAALNIALSGAQSIGAETQLINLRDYELVFCDGGDESNYPPDVFKLRQEIEQAQGIILGTPEYHSGPSGVLKNALDLMGFKEFQGKVVGLVGVAGGSTGAINSLNNLRTIARSVRAWVIPEQVSIAQAWKVFDDSGHIQDAGLEERLTNVGQQVARFAYLHTSEQAKEFLQSWEEARQNPGGA
jgi:NAD(P)H-dependent FMN reductase